METSFDHIDFQTDFINGLLSLSDYPNFNVDKVAQMFKSWLCDKEENIWTYRDKTYRSAVTGTMAGEHYAEWMDELDDNKERYLTYEPEEEVEEFESIHILSFCNKKVSRVTFMERFFTINDATRKIKFDALSEKLDDR